ncbi:MAG: Uncharacterised protein [Cryomorphaceae bacterium]|nr:MAG: Uncharacterised protein [Cryomorphaceae bacterium]
MAEEIVAKLLSKREDSLIKFFDAISCVKTPNGLCELGDITDIKAGSSL